MPSCDCYPFCGATCLRETPWRTSSSPVGSMPDGHDLVLDANIVHGLLAARAHVRWRGWPARCSAYRAFLRPDPHCRGCSLSNGLPPAFVAVAAVMLALAAFGINSCKSSSRSLGGKSIRSTWGIG